MPNNNPESRYAYIPMPDDWVESKSPDKVQPVSRETGLNRRQVVKGLLAAGVVAAVTGELFFESKERSEEKPKKTDQSRSKELAEQIRAEDARAEELKKAREELAEDLQSKNKIERPIRHIADYYLAPCEKLEHDKEFFPLDLFSSDFLIALKLQESGLDPKAQSPAGAVGLMQLTDAAIKDDSRMLYKLNKDDKLAYQGPIWEGKIMKKRFGINRPESDKAHQARMKKEHGKRFLQDSHVEEIKEQSMQHPECNEALGKLYLVYIFADKPYGEGIGREEYARGDIEGAQKLVASAYNSGPQNTKRAGGVARNNETQTYVKNIFNYMERLTRLRAEMERFGFSPYDDHIAQYVAKELDRVRPRPQPDHDKIRAELLEKTSHHILAALEKERQSMNKQLQENDIVRVIKSLNLREDIIDKNLYVSNDEKSKSVKSNS